MKLKCIENKVDAGIFSNKKEKIAGLTLGKVYTCFYDSDGSFIVFDDDKEWHYYDLELFEPVE